MGQRHRGHIIFNKNYYIYTWNICWQDQSRRTCNTTRTMFFELTMSTIIKRKNMGTTMSPTMEFPGRPNMDQVNLTSHQRMCTNHQHSLRHPNSHPMVIHPQIWNWRLQQQWNSMSMGNPTRMERETHTKPIITPSTNNINLHNYPTTGTWIQRLNLYG